MKDELRRQSVGQSEIDTKRTARDNDFQVGCINATLPAADHMIGFDSVNSAPKEELQDALGPRAGLPAIPVVPYVVGTVREDTPLDDLAAVNHHCNGSDKKNLEWWDKVSWDEMCEIDATTSLQCSRPVWCR